MKSRNVMKKCSVLLLGLGIALITGSVSAQSLKNKVIAHRGAWLADGLPQNSIASLKRAVELGCGGSEFDVWMTADSVLVVNHDPTHQGLVIETTAYQELAAKKLASGETIPTLEQYIRAGKDQKDTKLILEIKPSKISKERSELLAEKCVNTVKRLKAEKRVDYISFSYDAGLKVIALDKKANVSFLEGKKNIPLAKLKEDGFAGLDYHISFYQEHPEYFKQAEELGLTTNVWTVNKKEDMIWALDMGVDFITTNEPELLLQLLKSRH